MTKREVCVCGHVKSRHAPWDGSYAESHCDSCCENPKWPKWPAPVGCFHRYRPRKAKKRCIARSAR